MPLPSYDPVQFAAHAWSNHGAGQSTAAAALREMATLEFAEETILRAEDDCLVEYSQEAHDHLQRWYAQWVAAYRGLTLSQPGSDLAAALQRAEEWLQVQSDIARHSLSHAELSDLARQANLSAGARGASPPAP
jgi:hypothetical protein